jgi:hypothetical protein
VAFLQAIKRLEEEQAAAGHTPADTAQKIPRVRLGGAYPLSQGVPDLVYSVIVTLVHQNIGA